MMSKSLRFPLSLVALFFPLFQALAVVDVYEFETEEQRERYNHFIEELRCPKCQNQNLAGSNSPIAEDLRRELYRLIMEGKSDEEITEFMVDRYGEFVLYKPPVHKNTLLLWGLPIALLIIGLAVLALVLKRRKVLDGADSPDVAVEEERMHQLLQEAKARKDDSCD